MRLKAICLGLNLGLAVSFDCIQTADTKKGDVLRNDIKPEAPEDVFDLHVIHWGFLRGEFLPGGESKSIDKTRRTLCDPYSEVQDEYCVGGLARLQSLINSQYNSSAAFVLVVDAGDALSGSRMSNHFRGSDISSIYSAMTIDAYAIGLNDFSYGSIGLADFIGKANIPFASCNLNFTDDPYFQDLEQKRWNVVEKTLVKDGKTRTLKIAIVPLSHSGIKDNAQAANVKVLDPVLSAVSCCSEASLEVDVVVVASACGIAADRQISVAIGHLNKVVLIVGGAGEIYFGSSAGARYLYPYMTYGIRGPMPMVHSPGRLGMYGLAKLQLQMVGAFLNVLNVEGDTHLIQANSLNPDYIRPSCEILTIIESLNDEYLVMEKKLLAFADDDNFGRELDGTEARSETSLGDLVTDAYIWRWKQMSSETSHSHILALKASRSILGNLASGIVTNGHIRKNVVDGYALMAHLTCTGDFIREIIEMGLNPWSRVPFLQVGGLSILYDSQKQMPPRIMEIRKYDSVLKTVTDFNFSKEYHVICESNIFSFGNDFLSFQCSSAEMLPLDEADTIGRYMADLESVYDHYDGRLIDIKDYEDGAANAIINLVLVRIGFTLLT